MKKCIEVGNAKFYVEICSPKLMEKTSKTVVFFHGFSQTHETFYPLLSKLTEYQVVLIDLLGHGKSESCDSNYSFELLVELLNKVFEQLQLNEFELYGYSMGARIAMHYVRSYPKKVSKLYIESSSSGLNTMAEKTQRILLDKRIEEVILTGLCEFDAFWRVLPLFSRLKRLPIAVQEHISKMRCSHSQIELVKALRGFSISSQETLINKLAFKPVELIVGECDEKYLPIMVEMANMWNAPLNIVANAGHNVHVEQPEEVVKIIRREV